MYGLDLESWGWDLHEISAQGARKPILTFIMGWKISDDRMLFKYNRMVAVAVY